MNEKTSFIGVDITDGPLPITYVVLDHRLNIEKMGKCTHNDIVAELLGHASVLCGIDSASGPNLGLLAEPAYRQRMNLEPDRSNYSTYRVSEFELRRRGIGVYNTSTDPEKISGWVKEGWQLYDQLRNAGFVDHPQPGKQRMMEIHSHAAFTVLIGGRPYSKLSLEGQLQRQLVLYDQGVEVPDAMHTLQELTRHRFLTGQLNLKDVHSHEELDALIAAYTAFLADREPQHTIAVGDSTEGLIFLPVNTLKDDYS